MSFSVSRSKRWICTRRLIVNLRNGTAFFNSTLWCRSRSLSIPGQKVFRSVLASGLLNLRASMFAIILTIGEISSSVFWFCSLSRCRIRLLIVWKFTVIQRYPVLFHKLKRVWRNRYCFLSRTISICLSLMAIFPSLWNVFAYLLAFSILTVKNVWFVL